jgi:hypothetical protein
MQTVAKGRIDANNFLRNLLLGVSSPGDVFEIEISN